MPTLPSGRRIEFSLDRFHSLLGRMDSRQTREIAENMRHPDDLLYVMDAVHFSRDDGSPFFADYLAADWKSYASDWSLADRQALEAWFSSSEARRTRSEAIGYITSLLLDHPGCPVAYPYEVMGDARHVGTHEGSRLRQ